MLKGKACVGVPDGQVHKVGESSEVVALLIMGKLERDLFRFLKKVYLVVKRNLELREVRLKEEISQGLIGTKGSRK